MKNHNLSMSEPGQSYRVNGRFHHRRIELHGLKYELAARIKRGTKKPRKFVILGRPRSGSTLLTRLLRQHSRIDCRDELLNRNLLRPFKFVEDLASSSHKEVFGFKALSYQITDIHRIKDLRRVMENFISADWRIIHLTRNTFDQTLSLCKAGKSGTYHVISDKAQSASQKHREYNAPIDPELFTHKYFWNARYLQLEKSALIEIPHLHIDYDAQLTDSSTHQNTLDGLFEYLNVPFERVTADTSKVRNFYKDTAEKERLRTAINSLL